MRAFSSGGGVQSTAALVLASQGKIDFPIFVFANTGDDSERPETLDYVRNVAMPYAKKHGVEFHEVQKRRLGKHEKQSLKEHIYRTKRSIPLPIRLSTGALGNRTCTVDFKIRVVDKWIAENGGKGSKVIVGLGISTDEIHRARARETEYVRGFWKVITYPLIDLHINRNQCYRIIREGGLPAPAKSACYFCPYQRPVGWIRLKNRRPDLFEEAVKIEEHLNQKRGTLGKDSVFLHPALKPLDQAVGTQMMFDEMENCESGYCFV